MRIILYTFLLFLISCSLWSQDYAGSVDLSVIIMDEEVSEQMQYWKTQQRKEKELKVWRILIVGMNDRRSLNQAIDKFRNAYPEMQYDWEYDSPLYKLKTGVCIQQLRLKPILYEIRKEFPSALEIKDVITYEDYFKLRH